MRARLILLVLVAGAIAQADRLVSWQRRANLTLLEFERGAGEIEIVSPSTFRFVRCRTKPCAGRPASEEPVTFRAAETAAAFEFHTSYIDIRLRKLDGGLSVKSRHGVELFDEVVPPGAAPSGIALDLIARDGERFYGLGPRPDTELDLRGKTIPTKRPLLISSTGFGLWFTASSDYVFDLAAKATDRVSVRAAFPDRAEFYFHYGPAPKEVLEENLTVAGSSMQVAPRHTQAVAEGELPRYAIKPPLELPMPALLAWLAHASMSGLAAPALRQSTPPLAVESLFPLLYGGETSPLRRSLHPYLYTYLMEAKERGIPLFRPMAMQYPRDEAALHRLDQFMLGDELLVAAGKDVYLPMGLWTDLRTGELYKGRQTVPVAQADGAPLYVRNGTIVPLLQPDGTIQLHYFPRLGAEFFLSEPGDALPSQVHAGPAAGVLRLEIESRVARTYEWIVHRVSPAAAIEPASVQARYDAAKRTLHLPVRAEEMGDSIINITLEVPLEP